MAIQTEEEKAAIAKKFPKMIFLLQNGYCVFCEHRGKHRGCSFGKLPVNLDGNGCKYFRPWGVDSRVKVKNGEMCWPKLLNVGKRLIGGN
jgi:hypothetical protein